MTDLESPKKNNDCYFYYYSTCVKGDRCIFRHEPSALGCETVCSYWKEGKCLNIHCNFRHMELRKNRKAIPCYWETQPVGCLKAHCPFLHQHPRPMVVGSTKNTDLQDNSMDKTERKVTAVDSLVVNFEEESDGEFGSTGYSPLKTPNRIVKVKTLEEIKLEKIQAESAAFYSYIPDDFSTIATTENADDMRQRIVNRIMTKQTLPERKVSLPNIQRHIIPEVKSRKRLSDDELATILGDDSLRKKQKIFLHGDGNLQITLNKKKPEIRLSITSSDKQNRTYKRNNNLQVKQEVENIKIKTLEEIRAERNAKLVKINEEKEEAEVSSTSKEESPVREAMQVDVPQQNSALSTSPSSNHLVRKLRLRRKLPISENIASSSTNTIDYQTQSTNSDSPVNSLSKDKPENTNSKKNSESPNEEKMLDDVLLFEEDDEEYEITLKAEEDLLNDVEDD